MKKVQLSILELGFRQGDNSLSIVNDILEYCIKAEELNFTRFWLAEHHNSHPLHPYTNPEILITLIAGNTDRIRVGSAGALVGYNSPYFLACNYKLLNNLFCDRIDFGFSKGRPAHAGKHDFFKLRNEPHYTLFLNNLNAICHLYENEMLEFESNGIVIPPFAGKLPQLWYLSNGYKNMDLAISKRMNYCRSLIHGLDILDRDYKKAELVTYRRLFVEKNGFAPHAVLAMAISFSRTKEDIILEQEKSTNRREALSIIPVTYNSLCDLIYTYQELYGIDEFVIFDTESHGHKKIENLYKINEVFDL